MRIQPDTTPRQAEPGDVDHWRLASSMAVHPSSSSPSASDGGDSPLVAAIAAGLAAVSLPWELGTVTTPVEREYELILATCQYDAWLIHWPPGTGLDAHDHGGSAGAFSVVAGLIDEDVIAPDGTTTTRRLGAGETVAFGPEHVHAVVNRGTAGVTSVHVYSPPLGAMGFHGEAPGSVAAGPDGSWDIATWERCPDPAEDLGELGEVA